MSSTALGRGLSGTRNETVADLLNRITAGMSIEERLKQVQSMARAMDDQFSVPGTNIRFGWDSILGVVPGLGDALTSAISLLIVHHACRLEPHLCSLLVCSQTSAWIFFWAAFHSLAM